MFRRLTAALHNVCRPNEHRTNSTSDQGGRGEESRREIGEERRGEEKRVGEINIEL